MDARVRSQTGFRRSGILYAARTAAEMDLLEASRRDAEAFGVPAELIGARRFAELMPGAAAPVLGGLHSPGDGRAEPALAVPAMARAAQVAGVRLLTGCAVRGIETAAGRLSHVLTEAGAIPARSAVLAGGVWSRLFAGNLGINVPIAWVKGSVVRLAPVPGGPTRALGDDAIGLRQHLDGGYILAERGASEAQITLDSLLLAHRYLPNLVKHRREIRLTLSRAFLDDLAVARRWRPDRPTVFERVRTLDPEPSAASIARAMAALAVRFPALRGAVEVERWAGMMDVTPDGVPVIAPSPVPGLVLACGFSGHGFGLGPGAGRLAADLVTGCPPCVDPAPFALARFGKVRAQPRRRDAGAAAARGI